MWSCSSAMRPRAAPRCVPWNPSAPSTLERAWDLWDATPFAGLDACPFVVAARATLLSSGLSVAVDRGSALCALGR